MSLTHRGLLIFTAYLLDLFLGDPLWMPHPVVAIGTLISFLEKKLREWFPSTPTGERVAGILMSVVVPLLSAGVVWSILLLAGRIHFYLKIAVELFLCYQILAVRSLQQAGKRVYQGVESGDLSKAREAVSHIVGRNTEDLTMTQVVKATVETLAENTSDGILAPLLFMLVGGAPLGIFYKAVNTMDSMIAYKNSRYLYFGRSAAYLDDVCNWIPARLTGLLFVGSSFLLGYNGKHAWKILRRDAKKHLSPNAGYPEAAVAGALEIQLGGNSEYHGTVLEKATLGDEIHPMEGQHIMDTSRLLGWTSFFAVTAGCLTLIVLG